MTIPSKEELMLPTIKALGLLGGSATVQEMTAKVAEILNLSEEDQNAKTEGGRLVFNNRLGWTRNLLKHVLIENTGTGVWVLTPRGETARQARDEEIQSEIDEILRGQDVQANVENERASHKEDAQGADEEGGWKQELLATLMAMDPYAFEKLCQRLLRESGFKSVEVTKRSGDGGIDGFGVLQVNLVTFRVVFQCKRYSGSVGAPEVQKFRGAMQQGDKGLFITTGVFTKGSRETAPSDPSRSIDLVDGDRLCDLLKDLKLGVSTEMVERVNIDREWFLRV